MGGSALLRITVLLLCAALAPCGLAPSGLAAPEKRVALVIGNAADASISPLQKPLNDAQKMADVQRLGL